MHAEARAWIERTVRAWELPPDPIVLDIGGRDVNGTPRDLFPTALYLATDIEADEFEGPSPMPQMIVQDAREPFLFEVRLTEEGWRFDTWLDPARKPEPTFDVVLSTETFEHVDGWEAIVANGVEVLKVGGRFLVTAAADPRQPHSGIDGWELRAGEHYGNVDPDRLRDVLSQHLVDVVVEYHAHGDVYGWGVKL